MTNKVAALTKASLDKVWAWCEANSQDPLAESYMEQCTALGLFDYGDCYDRLDRTWRKKGKGPSRTWVKYHAIRKRLFEARDSLGRLILDTAKRESAMLRERE